MAALVAWGGLGDPRGAPHKLHCLGCMHSPGSPMHYVICLYTCFTALVACTALAAPCVQSCPLLVTELVACTALQPHVQCHVLVHVLHRPAQPHWSGVTRVFANFKFNNGVALADLALCAGTYRASLRQHPRMGTVL
eukprot:1161336-Pelagomonas_calceolata.AAC.3